MLRLRLRSTVLPCVFAVAPIASLSHAAWQVEALAGGGPDNLPALEANLAAPVAVAFDHNGDLLVLASESGQLLRVDANGMLHRVLQGRWIDPFVLGPFQPLGFATLPDGRIAIAQPYEPAAIWNPATHEPESVSINRSAGVTVDSSGRVYFSEQGATFQSSGLIRRYDPSNGNVEVVAGKICSTPFCLYDPAENALALNVQLKSPAGIAVDGAGNLYIAERGAHRVRRVDASDGRIRTLAGTGTSGYSGDGSAALLARLSDPMGVLVDASGNVLIADSGNDCVRRVDAANGRISTIAGTGQGGFSGDEGPAITARLDTPSGLALDAAGNLFIADYSNRRVRRVDHLTNVITTVAGNGTLQFSGDGYPATRAAFSRPSAPHLAVDPRGNLWITDTDNHRVRRVDAETGVVTTVAGNGDSTFDVQDDGLPASQVVTPYPTFPVLDLEGNLYFLTQNARLRRIDAGTGLVSTVPGISEPVAFDRHGTMYTQDLLYIYVADPTTGERRRIAGRGAPGGEGEYLPALEATLRGPSHILFDDRNDLIYTERLSSFEWRVRRISAVTGLVETIASGPWIGPPAPIGNSLPALGPGPPGTAVAVDADGGIWMIGHVWWDVIGARYDRHTGLATKVLGPDYHLPAESPTPDTDIERLHPEALAILERTIHTRTLGRFYRATSSNRSPVAIAIAPPAVHCTSAAGATVRLDGSLSHDPDDDPGGETDIAGHVWYEDHGEPTERILAKGSVVEVALPIGIHGITLEVRDASGRTDHESMHVEVRDPDDLDGDLVTGCVDNCPAVFNPEQIDSDSNGLGDACDTCLSAGHLDADADTRCDDDDNCPLDPNPGQADEDGDAIGDACDVCPALANAASAARGTCIDVSETLAACRTIVTDSSSPDSRGWIRLAGIERLAPQRLDFEIGHEPTQNLDTFEFRLNDQVLTTSLSRPFQFRSTFSVADAALIEALWRRRQPNEISFSKTGTAVNVQSVKVVLRAGQLTHERCLIVSQIGACGLFPSTNQPMLGSVSVLDPFVVKTGILDQAYGPGPPSASIDVSAAPFSELRMCVSATPQTGSGVLLAATESGELLEVDPFSAAVAHRGILPLLPDDIAFDSESGKGFVIGSTTRHATYFDPADGRRVGPLVLTQLTYRPNMSLFGLPQFNGLEFVHGALFTAFYSFLYTLDTTTGSADDPHVPFGAYGHRGLTFEEAANALWGFVPSNCEPCRWNLVRHDVATGAQSLLPDTAGLNNLQFGPDGSLYGIRSLISGSRLYLLDHENGATRSIGDIGKVITGLMLDGPQGSLDCVNFDTQGAATLAINASCGAPTAVIADVGDTPCTSAAGGVVILDGTASTDASSNGGAGESDLDFAWYEDYDTSTALHLGSGAVLEVVLSVGTHTITLRVSNRFGEAATASTTVRVFDDEAPTLSVSATPGTLWPPNHRMVELAPTIEAQDNCGTPQVRLVEATSSEPDDVPGGGDGHTTGDVQSTGAGPIALRAERDGDGTGRVYTLRYEAVDAAGQKAEATTRVVVPHSQGGASEPLRVTVRKTAAGTLVRWGAVSGAIYYDVIRGNLRGLAVRSEGVDLGAAYCVESGSLDTTTAGHEDATTPPAGEAFFYLVQYHDGWGPTSFGTESADRPLLIGSGGCR